MPRNDQTSQDLPRRESEVLRAVEEVIATRLPKAWTADFEPAYRIGNMLADARLTLSSPSGETAVLVVEAKLSPTPRGVDELLRRANQLTIDIDAPADAERGMPLLAARFLSARVRAQLVERETNYVDSTGNIRIVLSRPGLFIEAAGATRDPAPEKRPVRSLRGSSTARIIRALWETPLPIGVRALAEQAGVSPGTVSRVVDLLRRDDIVDPERGPIEAVNREALIERWAEDYSFTAQNTTSLFLEPRGLPALLDKLRSAGLRYAVTGSLAARLIEEYAEAKLAMVYVEDINRAADELGLTAVPTGGNVILAEPFDPVMFKDTWEQDGIAYANAAQVVADLLQSPGRGPEEGERLLRILGNRADA